MRKAELLSHEPKERDPEAKKHPGTAGIYSSREQELDATAQRFITKDGSEILEIDLWHGKALAARYFADIRKKHHISYLPVSREWRKFNINNTAGHILRSGVTVSSYYGKCGWKYWSLEDEKTAEDYVRSVTGTRYINALLDWETEIMSQRREKYRISRATKIARAMEEAVPEIPEGFLKWAAAKFGEYVFQEKTEEGVQCTCTSCRSTWIQPKGIGTKTRPCPKCGVTVRGIYGDEKTSVPKGKRRGGTRLYLLQPCRDNGVHVGKAGEIEIRQNWMERIFWADAVWDRSGKHIYVTEGIRIFLNKAGVRGTCWYLQWIREDGSEIWDTGNSPNWRYGSGYVYPGNLEDVMKYWNFGQSRAGINILADQGVCFDANAAIMHASERPAWEYLTKNGLTRLAAEDINETGTYGWDAKIVNHKGRTSKEILRLDGNNIDRLRRLNGGRIALKWLEYGQTLGLRISDETIRRYERRSYTPQSVWELLAYTRSPEKLLNYLEKQAKATDKSIGGVIGDYKDYLDMAKKQGLDLRMDLFARPRDLMRAHNECVRYAKAHEIELKADGIRKKFPMVEEVLRTIYGKYTYGDDLHMIIVPQKVEDIIQEGRILGHCIDTTDRYFDRIEQHISYLVFLRKAADPEKPWYTLEIEPGGTVRQQRTTGNNQNRKDAEEYMPFIRKWQKEVRRRITAADKKLAEKSRDVRIQEYKELRDKQEKVWRGALAGKLLVDVLEADLIEEVG